MTSVGYNCGARWTLWCFRWFKVVIMDLGVDLGGCKNVLGGCYHVDRIVLVGC